MTQVAKGASFNRNNLNLNQDQDLQHLQAFYASEITWVDSVLVKIQLLQIFQLKGIKIWESGQRVVPEVQIFSRDTH